MMWPFVLRPLEKCQSKNRDFTISLFDADRTRGLFSAVRAGQVSPGPAFFSVFVFVSVFVSVPVPVSVSASVSVSVSVSVHVPFPALGTAAEAVCPSFRVEPVVIGLSAPSFVHEAGKRRPKQRRDADDGEKEGPQYQRLQRVAVFVGEYVPLCVRRHPPEEDEHPESHAAVILPSDAEGVPVPEPVFP